MLASDSRCSLRGVVRPPDRPGSSPDSTSADLMRVRPLARGGLGFLFEADMNLRFRMREIGSLC
jgi:hypothetical protein